eukprot:351992-Chlamydomonas_euryale.AAC.4
MVGIQKLALAVLEGSPMQQVREHAQLDRGAGDAAGTHMRTVGQMQKSQSWSVSRAVTYSEGGNQWNAHCKPELVITNKQANEAGRGIDQSAVGRLGISLHTGCCRHARYDCRAWPQLSIRSTAWEQSVPTGHGSGARQQSMATERTNGAQQRSTAAQHGPVRPTPIQGHATHHL